MTLLPCFTWALYDAARTRTGSNVAALRETVGFLLILECWGTS